VNYDSDVEHLSIAVAVVLLLTYVAGLIFSLRTHIRFDRVLIKLHDVGSSTAEELRHRGDDARTLDAGEQQAGAPLEPRRTALGRGGGPRARPHRRWWQRRLVCSRVCLWRHRSPAPHRGPPGHRSAYGLDGPLRRVSGRDEQLPRAARLQSKHDLLRMRPRRPRRSRAIARLTCAASAATKIRVTYHNFWTRIGARAPEDGEIGLVYYYKQGGRTRPDGSGTFTKA
jgi:hypothetical protein